MQGMEQLSRVLLVVIKLRGQIAPNNLAAEGQSQ